MNCIQRFAVIALVGSCALGVARLQAADVLVVADEFPAMEVLASSLKTAKGLTSDIVKQEELPSDLALYQAVVVYIHGNLGEPVERVFIDYARSGGRLVVLHHSISSGKRKNRDWFAFLGVELATGDVEAGGYKWIEGISVDWVNLATSHPIMTDAVHYPKEIAYPASPEQRPMARPAFRLDHTEVYLNHRLKRDRIPLMGLRYTDSETGQVWMQSTAGWMKPVAKGWVIYFMPGHSVSDFRDATFSRILVNAIAGNSQ